MANNGQHVPYSDLDTTFNYNALQITFDIDLEYLGSSFDPMTNNYDLGTTYVIDFYSFRSFGDMIDKPGNCQNRQSVSFVHRNFNNYWSFSDYPYLSEQIGTTQTLSYPPPASNWILSADIDSCDTINYISTFRWDELIQCQDYQGNQLISVEDDGTSITLAGTLYVNVVSPYSMQVNDTGYYRSLSLIQQDFQISILKQINVLASTGVDLFLVSIIAVEIEYDTFRLTVLTQIADYMKVSNAQLLQTPFNRKSSM